MMCSFDVETTGLNPYIISKMFAFCIGYEDGRVEVHRLDNKDLNQNADSCRILRAFWKDTSIVKVGHNIKFDIAFVLMGAIDIPQGTVIHDTMLMARCLRNDLPHYSLDYLAEYYGSGPYPIDGKITQAAKEIKARTGVVDYSKIDKKLMEEYQIADGERTMLLAQTLLPEIRKDERRYADYRVEVDLIRPTQRMEQEGIRLDVDKAAALKEALTWDASVARDRLCEIAGREINPNSGKDVSWLLYEKLRLPILGYTDKGAISTDQAILLELRKKHVAADLILKAKAFTRGASTLEGYVEFLDAGNRIHPNINTCEATTGRESCDSPNLQNVSRETSQVNPYPIPLRRVFRADPGDLLLFVDYAGIEMRLIIEATGEPELVSLLQRDRNADVHYPTVECFEGREGTVTLKRDNPKEFKTLRSAYKNVGFCVAYGGGTAKVAMTIGRPVDQVVAGDTAYRTRFRKIATFSSAMIGVVKKYGYIETPFGRRLFIPKDKAYIASNYRIQGTAAEILKRAQIRVDACIQKKYRRWIKMILPIHDELVFSMSRDVLKDLSAIRTEFRELMVTMPEIKVPLEVEWKLTTTTWDRAREIK